MVPRENKNNAYAKFGGTNKEYYGIFQSGWPNSSPQAQFKERIWSQISTCKLQKRRDVHKAKETYRETIGNLI